MSEEYSILDFMLQRSKLVAKLIAENPELADHVELLEKVAKSNKQLQSDVKYKDKTIKDLQAELTYYIQINPNLKRNWNNLQKYKVMSEWFDEYRANGKKVGEAHKLIYDRAVRKGLIGEVAHYTEDGKADHDKAILDKVRKCLNTYRDRHKKAIQDRIERQVHTK